MMGQVSLVQVRLVFFFLFRHSPENLTLTDFGHGNIYTSSVSSIQVKGQSSLFVSASLFFAHLERLRLSQYPVSSTSDSTSEESIKIHCTQTQKIIDTNSLVYKCLKFKKFTIHTVHSRHRSQGKTYIYKNITWLNLIYYQSSFE